MGKAPVRAKIQEDLKQLQEDIAADEQGPAAPEDNSPKYEALLARIIARIHSGVPTDWAVFERAAREEVGL